MPYVLLSALFVVLDQVFKAWISGRLGSPGRSMAFLPGLMRLTLVHNYGASWGMLAGKTTLLLIVTALVSLCILTVLLLDKPVSPLGRLSLSFILGGAVGNALDRAVLGYVVDMFETEFVRFPVFNVADCCITIGVVLWILYIAFGSKSPFADDRKAKAGKADGDKAGER